MSDLINPRHYCYLIKFRFHWDNMHALLIEECSHPLFCYAKISRFTTDAEEGSIYIRYKDKRSLGTMIKTWKTLSVYPTLASDFTRKQGQAEFIEYGVSPKPRGLRTGTADLYKQALKRKRDYTPPTLIVVDDIPDTPLSSPCLNN